MKKYYLAYGSNLNMGQMQRRCPNAKPVGFAEIPDYELLFKGSKTGSYLTIEQKKGSVVPVGVWEVNESDERALDCYEGFPTFYYKKNIKVKLNEFGSESTRTINAFVYIMHEERRIGIPTRAYMSTCAVGYDDFGFDTKILIAAFNESVRRCEAPDDDWLEGF